MDVGFDMAVTRHLRGRVLLLAVQDCRRVERSRCLQNHARRDGVHRHRSVGIFMAATKLDRCTSPLHGSKVGRVQRPRNGCRRQMRLQVLGTKRLGVFSGLRHHLPKGLGCSGRQFGDGHFRSHWLSVPKQAQESALVVASGVGISRGSALVGRGWLSVEALDVVIVKLQGLCLGRNGDWVGADCRPLEGVEQRQ